MIECLWTRRFKCHWDVQRHIVQPVAQPYQAYRSSKHCLRVFDRHFTLTMDSMLDKLAENVSDNTLGFFLVCIASPF